MGKGRSHKEANPPKPIKDLTKPELDRELDKILDRQDKEAIKRRKKELEDLIKRERSIS